MSYTGKLKKSSLYVGTDQDNSQLEIGSDGQFLGVENNELIYKSPPSGGMQLIETKPPSSASSFDFLSIPDFPFYLLVINQIFNASNPSQNNLLLNFSNNNGVTYSGQGNVIYNIFSPPSTVVTAENSNTTVGGIIRNSSPPNSSIASYRAQIFITKTNNICIYSGNFLSASQGDDSNQYTGSMRGIASNFNALQIKASLGSLTIQVDGSISLYGFTS